MNRSNAIQAAGITSAHLLDRMAQPVGWLLSKMFPAVCGAGVCWRDGGMPLWAAWRDSEALSLILGHMVFVADLRQPRSRPGFSWAEY